MTKTIGWRAACAAIVWAGRSGFRVSVGTSRADLRDNRANLGRFGLFLGGLGVLATLRKSQPERMEAWPITRQRYSPHICVLSFYYSIKHTTYITQKHHILLDYRAKSLGGLPLSDSLTATILGNPSKLYQM
jgi:hypothetical protein